MICYAWVIKYHCRINVYIQYYHHLKAFILVNLYVREVTSMLILVCKGDNFDDDMVCTGCNKAMFNMKTLYDWKTLLRIDVASPPCFLITIYFTLFWMYARVFVISQFSTEAILLPHCTLFLVLQCKHVDYVHFVLSSAIKKMRKLWMLF